MGGEGRAAQDWGNVERRRGGCGEAVRAAGLGSSTCARAGLISVTRESVLCSPRLWVGRGRGEGRRVLAGDSRARAPRVSAPS
jgi:hypothetical protein